MLLKLNSVVAPDKTLSNSFIDPCTAIYHDLVYEGLEAWDRRGRLDSGEALIKCE